LVSNEIVMNVLKLKKIIKENHPEIKLRDLGMDNLANKTLAKVLLKEIIEEDVYHKYYLNNQVIENIVKTKEFGKRFSCLKTEKFSN
jgi:CTP synthase (UTP-ammonia lyase)